MEPLDGSADWRVVVKRVLLGCLIAQACCLPAMADEATAAREREEKRLVAASLSIGMPWLLYGALMALPRPIGKVASPVMLFPIGVGAGQVYAGDVVRGALVGAGGLVVFYATLSLGMGLRGPLSSDAAMNAAYAATGVYGLLAGWDAYHTVDRAKDLAPTTLMGPPTGGPPILPFNPVAPR
jgi:hypothetical protein